MDLEVLDRLLTTLAVDLHAFAVCRIEPGHRLQADGVDTVTVHYVLEGDGVGWAATAATGCRSGRTA